MDISGIIQEIGETQSFGSNGFTKRTILVKEDKDQYPQTYPIDFVKDKCPVLDGYIVGQLVKVGINLRTNEYNGKWFVNIQGWRIEALETPSESTAEQPPVPPVEAFEPQDDAGDEDFDDMPF